MGEVTRAAVSYGVLAVGTRRWRHDLTAGSLHVEWVPVCCARSAGTVRRDRVVAAGAELNPDASLLTYYGGGAEGYTDFPPMQG